MNGTISPPLATRSPSPDSQKVEMNRIMDANGDLASYAFPANKLKRIMDDGSKTPLLLIACGSFSPITYLHLRMFGRL